VGRRWPDHGACPVPLDPGGSQSLTGQRSRAWAAPQVTLIDGEQDLLGDGSIRLLPAPGHQSVQIGERLVIGGDVALYAGAVDDLRFPSFADDYTAQTASARRLRTLRDAGWRVFPGQDPHVLKPGPFSL
jgi:glyoxylase-like metal-dependent hydrolase (beta-lactamase superfamily II)